MVIQGNLVTPVGENPDGNLQGLKFDANGKLKVNVTGMLVLALTNQSITPYFTDITAAVNFRYFLDLSELTLTKSLIIPAGAVGDRIIVSITVAHDEHAFTIKGAAGITINGGSPATEWSRLLIAGESVELTADTTSNWQITNDGRIACIANFHRITTNANTTHNASAETLIDWNSMYLDVGGMGDLTNDRAKIRRGGNYSTTVSIAPASAISDHTFIIMQIWKNAAVIASGGLRQSTSAESAITQAGVFPQKHPFVVDDTCLTKFIIAEANIGVRRSDSVDHNLRTTFFEVAEVF